MTLDISKPNPGRVYDYLLGGTHHFEADRRQGEDFKKLLPGFDTGAKLGRQCLSKAVRYLAELGHKYFIDFASGLPTQDNVHLAAQSVVLNCKVVYSDIDPLTMAYSLEILGNTPNVKYIHCDAGDPEEMLNHSALRDLFGDQRKVAFVFMGISYFLSDAKLRQALQVMHDWAAPGSHLVLSFVVPMGGISAAARQAVDIFNRNLNMPFYLRTRQELLALTGAWREFGPGIQPYDVYAPAGAVPEINDPFVRERMIESIRGHVAFFEW
jgi:hypothetical protein